MRLALFRPLWGVIEAFDGQRSLKDALRAIKALGYEGVEVPFKAVYMIGPDKFQRLLRDSDLKVGFQVFSDGPLAPGVKGLAGGPYPGHPAEGESPQDHFEVFKAQVLAAREFEPAFVNSHSGKDYFTHSQALEFFAKAIHLEREEIGYDFVVTHETHRKRFFYSPWVCRDFLPTVPDLRLCADFSHFINVTEGMPDDKHLTEVITNLAPQVRHIHARVGYSHGPQVSDPRAPEWMPFTEGHEKWWDIVWKAQRDRGVSVSTLSPEHGPPTYQQTLPYSRVPVADIWEINHWLAMRQKERFEKLFSLH